MSLAMATDMQPLFVNKLNFSTPKQLKGLKAIVLLYYPSGHNWASSKDANTKKTNQFANETVFTASTSSEFN